MQYAILDEIQDPPQKKILFIYIITGQLVKFEIYKTDKTLYQS